ncbi:hypothetical protein [Krasilnikoviella flava]|uniref:Uncharacterized protein n=1 Tax=Krasilnikoviella flava TaxID=526729 RepID=A0A1T5L577_9MICO|nr:hypothetical protein [Krasilnikoviella flava]SKC71192.1 hypothetical protein SAMN04324258_2908 [Krasilnikoviella flava]
MSVPEAARVARLRDVEGVRVLPPGEPPVSTGMPMRRGASEAADRRLGEAAWPAVRRALRLPAGDAV